MSGAVTVTNIVYIIAAARSLLDVVRMYQR
jgi:hypothetical protein